jgi:broad specificity phosphatase PhoE
VATILLARHGETDWNAAQRWQGHADRPLSERGRAQSEELARRLDAYPLAAIYASDLIRARHTAEAVARRRELPVTLRGDLREVDCGSWSGRYHSDIPTDELERWRAGGKGWQGGESYEQMAERLVGAVFAIASVHDGDHVLVVSHGAAIRAVHARASGLSYHDYRVRHPTVTNAALSAVIADGGVLRELALANADEQPDGARRH